jgi:hypothetical protein
LIHDQDEDEAKQLAALPKQRIGGRLCNGIRHCNSTGLICGHK